MVQEESQLSEGLLLEEGSKNFYKGETASKSVKEFLDVGWSFKETGN